MDKIDFVNGEAPYINDTNLNQLQTNVENAINGILESGSNDNGSWIKYADGTMIVNQTVYGTVDVTTTWGSMYYGAVTLPNFPVSFVSRPTIIVSPQTQSGTMYILGGSNGGGPNAGNELRGGTVTLVRPTSRTELAYILDVIAIGRWKEDV